MKPIALPWEKHNFTDEKGDNFYYMLERIIFERRNLVAANIRFEEGVGFVEALCFKDGDPPYRLDIKGYCSDDEVKELVDKKLIELGWKLLNDYKALNLK